MAGSDQQDGTNHGPQSDRDALLTGEGYELEPDCSVEEFLAVAKVYARAVTDAFELTVSVSDLEWQVSKRAKRRAGAVKYREGTPEAIVLTWEQFAKDGWPAMAATIRHELIHVHLLNEGIGGEHGPEFRELAAELETPVHCDRFADPEWWVVCQGCETRIPRYRRSKLVRAPGEYRCQNCGAPFESVRNE